MKDKYQYERSDLGHVRASLPHLFVIAGLFSFLVNLLLLTSPLYMLHVYDRVLPSGAVQSLVALSLIALLAYSVMGALDHTCSRITARIAARFLTQLDQQVFSSAMQSAQSGEHKEPQAALKDLTSIEKFIASTALLALFDLPWVPVFFAGIYLFHPLLGAMTLVSGMAIISLSLTNKWASRSAFAAAMHCTEELEAQTQQYLNRTRLIRALGMQSTTRTRQHHLQLSAQIAQLRAKRAEAQTPLHENEIDRLRQIAADHKAAITALRDLHPQELAGLTLTAPINGVVHGLTISGAQAVVQPAKPILHLTPNDQHSVIKSKIVPEGINYLFVGQASIIKLLHKGAVQDLKGRLHKIPADTFQSRPDSPPYYMVEIALPPCENNL
jgi:ABC-type multidrug transport system fused ATPase/permease subunit